MTIPKVTVYPGGVANPDGSQTQPEFTANMFNQLSYEANLAPELNNTIEALNDAIDRINYDPDIPTTLPPVTATAGQTEFYVGLGLQSLQVNRDGTIEQSDNYSYDETTGYVTITTPASSGEKFQFSYNVKPGGTMIDISSVRAEFKSTPDGKSPVENMVIGNPTPLPVGETCTTGATVWRRIAQSIPSALSDFVPINDVWVEDFGAGDGNDDRPILQSIIDHIEASGVRTTIRSKSGKNYLLKSTQTLTESGNEVGLVIRDVNRVHIDFGWSQITDEVESAKEAVIAIAPTGANGDYAFGMIDGLWVEGNKVVRPDHVVKGNYGNASLAYCDFSRMRLRYSQKETWLVDGFVIAMKLVRTSFSATESGIVCTNNFGGANTGWSLESCSVDYAKLYGFRFTGTNGHTYVNLKNCTADYIGRDDNKVTHDDVIGTSAAYRLEDVRVANVIACGAEFCTAVLSTNRGRAFTIDGLYALATGHSDGVTEIPWRFKFEGFTERGNIGGVQLSSSTSPVTNPVVIVNTDAFNQNSIRCVDGSIPNEWVHREGPGQTTSSNMPSYSSPEDHYIGECRKGAGEALVTGKKLDGNFDGEWFDQSFYGAEATFRKASNSTAFSFPLLTVDDMNQEGLMSFVVDIYVATSNGNTPYAAATYQGTSSVRAGNTETTDFKVITPNANIIAPRLFWFNNQLAVELQDEFSVCWGKVIAFGRPSVGTVTFEWEI